MLTIVLCATGCATTQKASSEEAEEIRRVQMCDSMSGVIRLVTAESVPESRVRMAIPVDNLMKLPPGASLREHNGQATADITKSGDTIYVTATCDSLQRQIEYYEAAYDNLLIAFDDYRNTVKTADERRTNPVKTVAVVFIAGIIAGVLMAIILTKKLYGKRTK